MKLQIVFLILVSVLPNWLRSQDSLLLKRQQVIQWMDEGDFKKAFVLSDKISSENSEDLIMLQKSAICALKLGRKGEALTRFKKAVQMDSLDNISRLQLADLFEKEGKYNDAQEHYGFLIKHWPDNYYYQKNLGYVLLKSGKISNAIEAFELVYSHQPDDIEAIEKLGELYLKMGELNLADHVVTQGLVLDSTQISLRLLKAEILYRHEQYADLTNNMEQILKISDTSLYAMRMLGIGYLYSNEVDKALICFDWLMSHHDESEIVNYFTSLAYRLNKDTSRAIFYLQQAIGKSISENTSTYYNQLGEYWKGEGENEKALDAFTEAFNHSGDEKLKLILADLYNKTHQKENAIKFYSALNQSQTLPDSIKLNVTEKLDSLRR